MKAFVAVVLLVAAVGAQDWKLKNFQHPVTTRVTGQEEGKLYRELPYQTVRDLEIERLLNNERITLLSIQELYNTELFREYLNIPLFNQWFQQSVFQKYVASPLFQQFWTTPQFKQYFRNPVLFYKYVYPQLQAFNQQQQVNQYQPETTSTTGVFDRLHGINSEVYNGQYVRPVFGDRVVRDNVDLDLLRRIQQQQSFRPQQTGYSTPVNTQIYGRENHDLNNAQYKVLLDKIYRTLFLNKQGEVTGIVKTDIKTLPGTHVEEQTVGKIVDPTTGEQKITTGDVKIVDEKVVKVPEPARELVAPKKDHVDTIVDGELKKEAILKKLHLNKGKKVNTEELKTIHLPLTVEEEYRIRQDPALFTKNTEEQQFYNPIVAALYARYGKELLNKNLEGETLAFPQTYNTRDLYTQEPREFIPLQDKLNLYNPLLQKDIYYTEEIPKTFEGKQLHKIPLTYQTSLINSGVPTTINPEHFIKDIKA